MAAATAVSSAKRSLRAELKQRLRAMSAEERLRQSRLLAQKVIAHSRYQKSKRISIFLSMQDEVETEEIIRDIFRQGKTCFIPRYRFQDNHMDMLRLTSPDEIPLLPRTSWNILQPGEDEVREEALSTGECYWYWDWHVRVPWDCGPLVTCKSLGVDFLTGVSPVVLTFQDTPVSWLRVRCSLSRQVPAVRGVTSHALASQFLFSSNVTP
ncbi:5-formyltetrahydrofolate cyclo-ligase [Herpailurus yagouaroundi]|uniref:5-formyltetrahydrofolate cyclo-ligase n=1 Tax=Herpailurus yagouaroundi TaxID=1608482 RepID=UPI001AD738E0|nr:5-formyltetrahydrofolate cyclo-ligase [Puma yagouaroundi]